MSNNDNAQALKELTYQRTAAKAGKVCAASDKATELAIHAVKRQIGVEPKIVIQKDDLVVGAGYEVAYCGACGEEIFAWGLKPEPKYCDQCGQRIDNEPLFEEQKCRVCGCTDSNACEGGCYWVEPDLCSRCVR